MIEDKDKIGFGNTRTQQTNRNDKKETGENLGNRERKKGLKNFRFQVLKKNRGIWAQYRISYIYICMKNTNNI